MHHNHDYQSGNTSGTRARGF